MELREPVVIAVEGISDKVVLETISRRLERDLAAEGIRIEAIGGAHAISRFVAELGSDVAVRGLCDETSSDSSGGCSTMSTSVCPTSRGN